MLVMATLAAVMALAWVGVVVLGDAVERGAWTTTQSPTFRSAAEPATVAVNFVRAE